MRYGTATGEKHYAHTLNDTGVALGRMLISILDHYQQADGSVLVPQALYPWVGKERLEPNKLAALTNPD